MTAAVFLSDLHLGNHRCQATAISAFLKGESRKLEGLGYRSIDDVPQLYLVGDVFDDLAPATWPKPHRDVVADLLAFPRINYAPGNHDEWARNLLGIAAGKVTIRDEFDYVDARGKRFLVTHGDQFDPMMRYTFKIVPRYVRAFICDCASGWHSGSYAHRIENNAVEAAARRGYDGVICGHTHRPDQFVADRVGARPVEYVNCGDWLHHRTAVIDAGVGPRLIG